MDFPWNQPSYWGTPMTLESRIWDDRSVSRFPKHKLPNDLEYFVPSHDGMPLSKLKSIEGIGNIFSQPLGCPRLCRLWRIINCLKVSLVTSFEWPVTWGSKLNTTGRAPKHLTHRVPIYRFLEVNSRSSARSILSSRFPRGTDERKSITYTGISLFSAW